MHKGKAKKMLKIEVIDFEIEKKEESYCKIIIIRLESTLSDVYYTEGRDLLGN